MRTRIKICGITRPEDAVTCANAGADAVGLVFYPPSPRHVSLEQARSVRFALPPFVAAVALFVDAPEDQVREVIDRVRPDLLQFHGDESQHYCAAFGLPYLKACRVGPGTDLLEYLAPYSDASGWLADAYVEGYGGSGTRFDWSLVPLQRARPLVLSGGLTSANVREAIHRLRPWGVDVSSGVESARGIKDAGKIAAFIAEVRNADV